MNRTPRVACLLFFLLLGAYLANGRTLGTGDTIPARYLPFAILRHATFALDGLPGFDGSYRWYVRHVESRIISDYPVGTALLALPVYLPFVVAGVLADGPWPERLEKLAASLLVAASGAVLFLALLRLVSVRWAVALALVYGLGTSALSVSSQALWQHTGSQLALAATLYCVLRGREEAGWAAAAGFPMAFAVICRPTDALLVVPIAAYVLGTRRDWRFIAWAVPPLAFQAWYGAVYFGNSLRAQYSVAGGMFNADLRDGLYGLLLSPGRGILAYSPIFVLSVMGAVLAWRPGGDGLLRAVSVGIVPTILVYARWMGWSGGLSYGPRLLADLTPLLTMLIVPVVPLLRRSRAALGFALGLAVWSATVHTYGVVPEWSVYYRADRMTEVLWEWEDHPVVGLVIPRRPVAVRRPEPFFDNLARWDYPSARVRLTMNDTTFVLGDTMRVGLEIENSTDRIMDLYVGVYMREARVAAFLPAPNRLRMAVPVTRPEWFRRVRMLPARSHVSEPHLLIFTFPPSFGAATLYAFAALVEPGSTPWRVVAADVQRFEVREGG